MRNLSLFQFVCTFFMLAVMNGESFAQSNFEKDAETLIIEYFQKSAHINKNMQYQVLDDVYDESSGIRHINAQQQINGIFVKDALLGLHFSKVYGAVSPTDQFAEPKINADQPTITSEEAVLDVIQSLGIVLNNKLAIKEPPQGLDQHIVFDNATFAAAPIKARLIYVKSLKKGQPMLLTWETQIYTLDRQHYWITYTDALNGKVVEKQDLVLKCHFGGVETDGSPDELMQMEKEHKALHEAAAVRIAAYISKEEIRKTERFSVPFAKPNLFSNTAMMVPTANTYLVLNEPAESPTDNIATNTQTNVTTSGHPTASPYGWTSDDGVTDYTYTRGNNVWAFQDPSPGPVGGVPNPLPIYSTYASNMPAVAPYTYNYPWDLSQEPEYSTNNAANLFPNRNAANVNLFYWNNLMHDVFYPFGFNEKGRNFQNSNIFGGNNRGGIGNDGVLAQSQDGGGTNNANFLTLADGVPGQMQMYLWTAAVLDDLVQITTVTGGATPPPSNGTKYPSIQGALYLAANESNVLLNLDLNARPVLNKDFIVVQKNATASVGTSTQGCGASMGVGLAPANTVLGKIVLIDRGSCSFVEKVHGAQLGGAVGVIVMNNDATNPNAVLAMGGSDATINTITIPAVMVSYNKGIELKAALASGATIIGSLKRDAAKIPKKDGDFDNGVIAHEYGHGISSRTSPQTVSGGSLSGSEQGGEGWSDFWALYMTTRTNNMGAATAQHPNGVLPNRGIGTYVTYSPISGPGIRPRKYSIDNSVNEFVFAGANGLSNPTLTIPHGIGFVWCTMLYEVLQEMIDQYPLSNNIYFSPNNVADLASAGGNNVANKLILEGIRLQPSAPTFIQQRNGILKADTLLYGGIHSCRLWRAFAKRGLGYNATDADNALGNETNGYQLPPACDPSAVAFTIQVSAPDTLKNSNNLQYTIKVTNTAVATINVDISNPVPANTSFLSASDGGGLSGSNIVWTGVSVSAGQTVMRTALVTVTTPTASTLYFFDNQENGTTKWTTSTANPLYPWSQITGSAHTGTTSWFVPDPDALSDAALTTASSIGLPNMNGLKLYFNHKYGTEVTFDGGTLETALSPAGPWTTVPIGNFESNGYPSEATVAIADNPLFYTNSNNGSCFGGSSGNFIQSIVNLDAYKNSGRFFRFRFMSDVLTPGVGWNVDNVFVVSNPIFINNTITVTSGITTKTGVVATLITENNAVLSATLTRLSAKAQPDKTIHLNWETATEINSKGFFIERQAENEKAFMPLSFVDSKGNNGAVYQLIDKKVESGKLYYYRLRQVDLDGKEVLSNIVSAKLEGKSVGMNFSNPVNNLLNINLTNITDHTSGIRILGIDGRAVYSSAVSPNDDQMLGINVSSWAKGIYIIQLKTGAIHIVGKLIVQ